MLDTAHERIGNGSYLVRNRTGGDVTAVRMRRVIASLVKFDPSTCERRPVDFFHKSVEQPVLGLHEALREERIVLRLRVDVRHAPAIPHHANRRREPIDDERPVGRGNGAGDGAGAWRPQATL